MSTLPENRYSVGAAEERPWGRWKVIACGDGYVVKEIVVKPGQSLSLQSHDHRSEHWVILSGSPETTVGTEVVSRGVNDSIFIPAGTIHRIANPGAEDVRFIEVQTGKKLSEDDIHRYEDRYGRAP